jgi:hypothetical protein
MCLRWIESSRPCPLIPLFDKGGDPRQKLTVYPMLLMSSQQSAQTILKYISLPLLR